MFENTVHANKNSQQFATASCFQLLHHIRAKLGKDNLEEKVMRLEQILPNLSGESGVLDLQNYSEDRKNVTFQKDG